MKPDLGAHFFGESPRRTDVWLTVLGAVGGVVGLVLMYTAQGVALSALQWLILIGLMLDIGGGVVANVTRATNAYYTTRPPRLSVVFLLVHGLQPALAVAFLGAGVAWAVALYAYALIGGLVVVRQRGYPSQRPLAMLILMGGIVAVEGLFSVPVWLGWFAPLYLIKLVYGFAVRHDG